MRKVAFFILTFLLLMGVSSAARADIEVRISIKRQMMDVTVDGQRMYAWQVSTARRGYSTPRGNHSVTSVERYHYSKKYRASMPLSIFFDEYGDAIHSGDVSTLSHGCVHLEHKNAATLFTLVAKRPSSTRIIVE